MSIQRNMFSDVAIQNIGHVIIGTAIARNPDLNSTEFYSDVTFEAETHNDCWQEYMTQTQHVFTSKFIRIMEHLDGTITRTAEVVRDILKAGEGRMIAGTLRMHMTLDTEGNLSGTLIWVQKRS